MFYKTDRKRGVVQSVLLSPRFRGIPRFENIAAGNTASYLRFGDQGDA
jgi:hypothetical protein